MENLYCQWYYNHQFDLVFTFPRFYELLKYWSFCVLQTTDKLLCLNILDCINNIYCSDNANYFILEPQHTLSLFIGTVPEKHTEVQERIFRLLELVICNLNWVPCPELIAVSILFKNKPWDIFFVNNVLFQKLSVPHPWRVFWLNPTTLLDIPVLVHNPY